MYSVIEQIVKKGVKMEDKEQNTTKSNTHAIVLAVIGVILLVLGILIVSVRGAPLRGSGVGTIAIIAGIILLVIAWLRASRRRAAK
jgi:protein-S-isoprenylcysteine O-methyltransferase Ste14